MSGVKISALPVATSLDGSESLEIVQSGQSKQVTNRLLNSPRVTSITSSATPTPNVDTTDQLNITALEEDSEVQTPTGTPVDGQPLLIRVRGAGAFTLTFVDGFRFDDSTDVPAITEEATVYFWFKYNSFDSVWDCERVSSYYGGVDPDVAAFISAAGITDAGQKTAINTLVTSLKSNSLWSGAKAIYPFVGGSAASHKWNLKDPRDLDAAFRLAFSGGWTHSATGAKGNGTSGYANTFLAPSALIANNTSFGRYNGDKGTTTGVDMGVSNSGNSSAWAIFSNYSTSVYGTFDGYAVTDSDAGHGLGLYSANRNSTITQLYRNGTLVTSAAETPTGLTDTFYIGALNKGGTANFFSNKECRFAYVMSGLTADENQTLETIINQFQIDLGRNLKKTYCFGDSVTLGSGASGNYHRWTALLCASRNTLEVNYGIGGSTLQSVNPVDVISSPNMYDRKSTIPTYNALRDDLLNFGYCINDTGLTYPNYNTTNYTSQLIEIINVAVAKGWPIGKIFVHAATYVNPATAWDVYKDTYGAPNYADTTRFLAFQAAALSACTTTGVKNVNPYDTIEAAGGVSLLADPRHLNDAGYLVAGNYIISQTAGI